MKWALAFAVIMLNLHPHLALAQRERGTYVVYWHAGDLYKNCTAPDSGTICMVYIEAIADVLGHSEQISGNRACMPGGVNGNRLQEIFLDFIEKSPATTRELGAAVAVTLALAEKYPC